MVRLATRDIESHVHMHLGNAFGIAVKSNLQRIGKGGYAYTDLQPGAERDETMESGYLFQ